jgi:hypothetical protein
MHATRALLAAGAVLALAVGTLTPAAPAPQVSNKLVVHEWGTFSSFSGSDGVAAQFYPKGSDLPPFVYSSVRYSKEGIAGTVSLETPVLYFYADKPVTASVRADFPAGVFTEWFPQAGWPVNKTITWADVRVRPGEPGTLPTAPGKTHYFAAREVDAAPVTVVTKDEHREIHENERFLFYRGVGDPKTPLAVKALGSGTFSLRVTGDAPIAAALLMEVKAKQVRFRQIDALAAGPAVTATLPADWTAVEPVRATLVTTLVQAGLFEKEARAMVKTWESAWFGDDGTRVLYVLPKTWTDRTLPLKVTPTPDAVVRVMVGRHDVLTPEREREIDGLVPRIYGPEGQDRTAALAALNRLGRFSGPALDQADQRRAKRR